MEQLSANTLQRRKKYIPKSPPLARRSSITISKPLPPSGCRLEWDSSRTMLILILSATQANS